MEGANGPPSGDLPSNIGSAEAEVDAAVDDPNTLDVGIRSDSDRGTVFAGVVVLLLEAPEENPKGLEDGALPNPDKLEDPGAGDANNVDVPNGDDEGDRDPAAVAELDPNMLAV